METFIGKVIDFFYSHVFTYRIYMKKTYMKKKVFSGKY